MQLKPQPVRRRGSFFDENALAFRPPRSSTTHVFQVKDVDIVSVRSGADDGPRKSTGAKGLSVAFTAHTEEIYQTLLQTD